MNLRSIFVGLMFFSSVESKEDTPVTPVEKLDVTKYTGLWYEMYYDKFAATFQGSDVFCTTAKFTNSGEGTVDVMFFQRLKSPTGQLETLKGTAKQDGTDGKFTLTLDIILPMDFPYWVIQLGPEKNGLYEFSVATDPMKMGLYVLARDVETFTQNYEHKVLEFVSEQGFITDLNKPIAIPQCDKCQYPPKTLYHDKSEL